MNAYSDHEAYKAVSKRLEEYVVDLEDTVHSAHASENHVRELQEKVSELGKELNEQLANTRITQVVPAVNEVATRLHGHVAKEMHALNGIVVSDDVVYSIMNGGVITESVECPKEVLEEIRDALEMPKYLPLDQIPEYVQKMNDAFEFNTKMIQTEKLRAEEHKTRGNKVLTRSCTSSSPYFPQQVNKLTSSVDNPLFQPEHLNSTNLKTFVDSVKASSDKYTHEMNQLMFKIETETMQDAQQARLVSARISHGKDMLMKRRG
ncbi:hypothetical protein HDU99_001010 [Rhizoclosmatium hyalinum]|nr:hypothetical protein HDU99_001010 [Rhizoclosmatium hyalinum]